METFYMLIRRDADTITWWQMSVRAVLNFAYALTLYRVLPRRAYGGSANVDTVLTVIIGSNLSRALTGNAPLVETMAATTLMGGLHYLLALAARRSRQLLLAGQGALSVDHSRWGADRRCSSCSANR
jgi:uncharacterized membrane protein YcaP (DUF421 family)